MNTLDKIDAVTKAHIANDVINNKNNKDNLIKYFNHIPNKGEFIETIMNEGCPCYVKKETITPSYAADIMAKLDEPVHEGAIDNIKSRFSKKFADFKAKGVRSIKNDVYELNLRLRCAESEMDLMYVIRTINSDVAILQDYLTEEIPEDEREEIVATLQELYDIRQRAAKEKKVRDTSSSVINVVYPDML